MMQLTHDHFYFIRHGQTDANLQRLMCGANWNICLNETGIQQIDLASEILSRSAGQINTICASPLLRTRQTAEIIAKKFSAPIVYIDELREWDIGHWDRMPFEQVKDEFLGSGEPVGGESRAQFKERVSRALHRVQEQRGPSLIVSHGAVWMAMQQFLGVAAAKVDNGIPHKVFRSETSWIAERLTDV